MKYILLLFAALAYGQGETVVVYGRVTSDVLSFEPFSYSGIMIDVSGIDHPYSSSISVNKDGSFSKSFPKGATIEMSTYYPDFYSKDTVVTTGMQPRVEVNFKVSPKIYLYSEVTANADIKAGKLQLITQDTLMYNWNKKLGYTKQFGFDYLLLAFDDYEFDDNASAYNYTVTKHLATVNDSLWYSKLSGIEDSLRHIEADTYSSKNSIDLNRLKAPEYDKLSPKMKKAIAESKEDAEWLKIISLSEKASQVLYWIDKDKEYHHIFEAEYWMAYNYESIIPELIKRITNKKEVGLINTADLIIWERIDSGDLKFYGHGGVAFDDLFTVAGRANHLLSIITGEDFGRVSMYATEADLKKLQNRWAYWLLQLQE